MFWKNRLSLWMMVGLALFILAACAPAAEPPANTAVPPQPQATATPEATAVPQPEGTVEVELNPQPQDPQAKLHVTTAVNDLAARLDIDGADIEVVAYEPVTWRDGSLGCPQPDQMYTQALVDGYMIQLRAAGETYNYHGAAGSEPFLCENE